MKIKTIFFILVLSISVKLHGQYDDSDLKGTREGIFVGLGGGTWLADNKNKVLGHPLILGLRVDYRIKENSFSLNFDIVGLGLNSTTKPVKVKLNDSVVVNVNDFSGSQITLEYGRILYAGKKFGFETNCGVGWGRLSYYNPTAEIDIGKSSVILNPGLSFGYDVGKRDLIQLKIQYYICDYRLKDNISTDLKGNYLELKLMWTGTFENW